MKLIPLSGKKGSGKFAMVDDEDYDFLIKYKWHVTTSPHNIYASHSSKGKRISMHRLLMNPPSGMQVDHKDHNGLNNQKSNLRVCTKSQNQMNKTAVFGRSSRYLGVSVLNQFDKKSGKIYRSYRAQIQISKGKTHIISKFPYNEWGEIEAAIAYNEAAKKIYGEFANLNKI